MKASIDDPCWTALALGELEGPEKAEAEKLLATHPDLAEAYAELARTVHLLQEEFSEGSFPEFDADRRRSVLHEHTPRRPIRLWIPTAVAAALAVGFGLVQVLSPFDEPALIPDDSLDLDTMEESEEEQKAPRPDVFLTEALAPAPRMKRPAEKEDGRSGKLLEMERHQKDAGKNRFRQPASAALADEILELEREEKAVETQSRDSGIQGGPVAGEEAPEPTPTPTPTPTPVPMDGIESPGTSSGR